jgi:hypothetical protein
MPSRRTGFPSLTAAGPCWVRGLRRQGRSEGWDADSPSRKDVPLSRLAAPGTFDRLFEPRVVVARVVKVGERAELWIDIAVVGHGVWRAPAVTRPTQGPLTASVLERRGVTRTQELLCALGHRATAVEHNLETASGLLTDLVEDDRVGQAGETGDVVLVSGLLGGKRPVENCLLEPA